jgi:hypothetical protein
MLTTYASNQSSSESADTFPRLRAGTRVVIVMATGREIAGVTRVCLPGWLVLNGVAEPIQVEDVRQLKVET